mmetsp:Transcript_17703/g.62347  ORF Transcript_17703/g.62347 Transcript_17703/m.62347 type:complete len:208 (+) Transcript_17703:1545-2168(+)
MAPAACHTDASDWPSSCCSSAAVSATIARNGVCTTLMAQPSTHTAPTPTAMAREWSSPLSPSATPICDDHANSSCDITVATTPPMRYGRRRPYADSHRSLKVPTSGCTMKPVTAPADHVSVDMVLDRPRDRKYDVCVANSADHANCTPNHGAVITMSFHSGRRSFLPRNARSILALPARPGGAPSRLPPPSPLAGWRWQASPRARAP